MNKRPARYTGRLPAIMVDPDTLERVTKIAFENDKSVGAVVRDAIAFYLQKNDSLAIRNVELS